MGPYKTFTIILNIEQTKSKQDFNGWTDGAIQVIKNFCELKPYKIITLKDLFESTERGSEKMV